MTARDLERAGWGEDTGMSMHTEEKARELWCPMVRSIQVHHYSAASFKPSDEFLVPERSLAVGNIEGRCVASRCMMWRVGEFDHQRNLPQADKTPNVGYCGLAGRPA